MRLRFSVGRLILCMAVVCAASTTYRYTRELRRIQATAEWNNEHNQRLRLIQDIIRLGGSVSYRDYAGKNVARSRADLRKGKALVDKVYLASTTAPDTVLRRLDLLPGIQFLSLNSTHVGDKELALIHDLRGLRHLQLNGTNVTEYGLFDLSVHLALVKLTLNDVDVGDEIVMPLSKMNALRQVHLAGTKLTEHGFRRLQEVQPRCDVFCEHSPKWGVLGDLSDHPFGKELIDAGQRTLPYSDTISYRLTWKRENQFLAVTIRQSPIQSWMTPPKNLRAVASSIRMNDGEIAPGATNGNDTTAIEPQTWYELKNREDLERHRKMLTDEKLEYFTEAGALQRYEVDRTELWVLEIYRRGEYRQIRRWTPDDAPHRDTFHFQRFCRYLVSLAGESIE